jgi:rfaE bifunctional protein nucleotidyltransferase chain/domain
MLRKILDVEAVDSWVADHRAGGRTIGFTCGAFDLLHAGHVDLLERGKALCDRLLVAVNSDNSIRQYKNPLRPANPQAQRMKVVAALGCVDAVVLLEERRPLHLIERWRPDFYIKGGDYSGGGLRSATAVESYGGKVVLIPFSTDQSTTAIMERISAIEAHRSLETNSPNHDSNRIIFLDRDGTLIRHVPYLHDPGRVEVIAGVIDGLVRLRDAGFKLVIVTNQQGIGLGYFTTEDFFEVNIALFRALAVGGVKIDRVYFCPHSFPKECSCRKPGTALLEKAIEYYGAKARDCWMLGDSQSDVMAGEAAGCRTILINPDANASVGGKSFTRAVEAIISALAS